MIIRPYNYPNFFFARGAMMSLQKNILAQKKPAQGREKAANGSRAAFLNAKPDMEMMPLMQKR